MKNIFTALIDLVHPIFPGGIFDKVENIFLKNGIRMKNIFTALIDLVHPIFPGGVGSGLSTLSQSPQLIAFQCMMQQEN